MQPALRLWAVAVDTGVFDAGLIKQLEAQGRVLGEAIQLEACREARAFGQFKRLEGIVPRRRQPVEQPPAPNGHEHGDDAHADQLADVPVRMDPLRHACLTHEAVVPFRGRLAVG